MTEAEQAEQAAFKASPAVWSNRFCMEVNDTVRIGFLEAPHLRGVFMLTRKDAADLAAKLQELLGKPN